MRYALVATASYILVVDLVDRVTWPIEEHRPEYYGVSWFAGGKHLVLSHSGLDNQTLVDVATYAQSEVGWISEGELESERFLSQPHQILCLADGRVACTNTGRNALTIIDPRVPGLFREARVSSSRWDRVALDNSPGDHLNSVFARHDRLYVLAHRFTKGSQLAEFSLPDLRLIESQSCGRISGLHNIFVTDQGNRLTCHSGAGSLIDLSNNRILWESGSAGYTRGLAASREHVLIGESQKSNRASRSHSMSGLWILDRRTWQACDYIALGPYGAVHEVRLLDVADEAHHGHQFAGLSQLLATDLRRTLEERKLSQTKNAASDRQFWNNFDMILGTPEPKGGGIRIAAGGDLCLAILRDEVQDSFGFRYEMDPGKEVSHVSLVVGYQGNGGDTDMVALLILKSKLTAELSIWRQDGTAWQRGPAEAARQVPLAGYLLATITANELTLEIDGKIAFRTNNEALGIARCDLGLGIRWIGSTVQPSAPKGAIG